MSEIPLDGVTVLAVILIASFAIDRIVTGTLIVLSFIPIWNRWFPDPSQSEDAAGRSKADKKQKLVYFVLAAILGIGVLAWSGNIRLFTALKFAINPIMDTVVTGLILVAGADRIAGALKMMGAGGPDAAAAQQPPIEITGKLVLEQQNAPKET